MSKVKQTVFLGSSGEATWLAKEIEGALRSSRSIVLDAWYHFGSWDAGRATLEVLERRLEEADFAILILSEDDLTQSRGSSPTPSPRDNVLLELGLFMGRLGRDRAFFLYPKTGGIKFPSDLYGITGFPYEIEDRSHSQREISPICTDIEKRIQAITDRDRAKGKEPRPKLFLSTAFPHDDGEIEDQIHYISSRAPTVIRTNVTIDDPEITDVRIYFDPRLNLKMGHWNHAEDTMGLYYWAANPQVNSMKDRGHYINFVPEGPKRGSYFLKVVALRGNKPRYEKAFSISVS